MGIVVGIYEMHFFHFFIKKVKIDYEFERHFFMLNYSLFFMNFVMFSIAGNTCCFCYHCFDCLLFCLFSLIELSCVATFLLN